MELKAALEDAEVQLKEHSQKECYRDFKRNFSVIVKDNKTEKRFKIARGLSCSTAMNMLAVLAKRSRFDDIDIYDEEKRCFVVGVFLVKQEWVVEGWREKVEFIESNNFKGSI